jgi:hypothetical protein
LLPWKKKFFFSFTNTASKIFYEEWRVLRIDTRVAYSGLAY